MKIVRNKRTIDPSTITDVRPLSANTDDAASVAISNEVVSSLYHDIFAAVLRELASNGRDAICEAGSDAPVEITLPTELNPTLVVTDHGVGMTLDVLENVFWKVNGSTKRESNVSIGCFGIGGMSSMSISDQFTVTTTRDGLTNTAIFFLDDADIPQRALVAKNIPTDAPSGTTVSVPVNTADIDAIKRALHTFDYWPSGSLLIDGEPNVCRLDEPGELVRIDDTLYVENQSTYRSSTTYRHDAKAIYVVSGGVRYGLTDEQKRRVKQAIGRRGFIAISQIGDVRLNPSREWLKERHEATDAWLDAFAASVPERIEAWLRARDAEHADLPYVERLNALYTDAQSVDEHGVLDGESTAPHGGEPLTLYFDGHALASRGLTNTRDLIQTLTKTRTPVVVITGLDAKAARGQKARRAIRAWLDDTYMSVKGVQGVYVHLAEDAVGHEGMLSWGGNIDGDLTAVSITSILATHAEAPAPRKRYASAGSHRVWNNGRSMWLSGDDLMTWLEAYPDFRVLVASQASNDYMMSTENPWYVPTLVVPRKITPRWLREYVDDLDTRMIGGTNPKPGDIYTAWQEQQKTACADLGDDDIYAARIERTFHRSVLAMYIEDHPDAHPLIHLAADESRPCVPNPKQPDSERYELLWHLSYVSEVEIIERYLAAADSVSPTPTAIRKAA